MASMFTSELVSFVRNHIPYDANFVIWDQHNTTTVPVHALYLSEISTVFQRMFNQNWIRNPIHIPQNRHFSPGAFVSFLGFFYKEKPNFSNVDFAESLYLSEMYGVDKLKARLCERMVFQCTVIEIKDALNNIRTFDCGTSNLNFPRKLFSN